VVTFVDTSALYAFLAADDEDHPASVHSFERLVAAAEPLVTHSYVVVESTALVQRRLGFEAVAILQDAIWPQLEIVWVDQALHDRAAVANRAAARPAVSLVDWTSFLVMRDRRILDAWAFDRDFLDQGFRIDLANR
jgi:predicted nucleic acid-binding protein